MADTHDMHLIRDICSDAICPYCDERITSGPTEHYGSHLMHAECYQKFGEELHALDESEHNAPKIPVKACSSRPSDDDLEYAYQRYYGFGSPRG